MPYKKLYSTPEYTPIEISTDAEMAAVLLDDNNLGKVYKFTGTSGTYINGDLYEVERSIIALIPIMTSNTTPSGIASASEYRSGHDYRAYMAFGGDITTSGDVWYGVAFHADTFTRYQWESPISHIDYVEFAFNYQSASSGASFTMSFQVYDGTSWTTISDTYTGTWENNTTMFTKELNLENVYGIGLGITSSGSSSGYGSYFTTIQAYGY